MKGLSIEELSEYFGVPEEMVRLRLKMLSLNKKQDSK